MSDASRELIEAYDDAWNRQDLDALCAFHADDVVFENHTAGERAEGADAVRAHIGGIFERVAVAALPRPPLLRGGRLRRQRVDGDRDARRRDADRVGRGGRLPAPRREDRAQGRLLVVARPARPRREDAADAEAAAAVAGRLDRAAGGEHDVLHDREAEAGAARRARGVRAPEALEQARQVGLADADAVVGGGQDARRPARARSRA